MGDTNDTGADPPATPAVGLPGTETRESLDMLREIEQRRLAEEAAADRARQEAAARERTETERREREAAAERDRRAKAEAAERQRAEAAAAERARLLDVERRLADQERVLRAEFELERARLAAELARAQADSASLGSWIVSRGLIIAVTGALLFGVGAWWVKQRVEKEIAMQRSLAAAVEHTRCEAQLKPLHRTSEEHAVRIGQLERDLTEARERAARAEARVQELEHAPPPRARPRRAAAPAAPRPSVLQRFSTDVGEDPLGPLADDPPDEHRRP